MDIKRTKFISCVMREIDFFKANLIGCDFENTNLLATRFQNCNFKKASFIGAKNYFVDPVDNNVRQAKFSASGVLSLLSKFKIEIV